MTLPKTVQELQALYHSDKKQSKHQFDTMVPEDRPRLMDKESIESIKREAYNQAIEHSLQVIDIWKKDIELMTISKTELLVKIANPIKELKK